MRAVVQRVSAADVQSEGQELGRIGPGLLVLLGVADNDDDTDLAYLLQKLPRLRIFKDAADKMNLSVQDVGGSMLVVSQFTLYGDCRKGNRPGFDAAARPDKADDYYQRLVEGLRREGINVQTGKFRTTMQVSLVNEGPVTILLDSKRGF